MLDGHEFYAYLPGGASGGILPASKGDIPLDFDTLQPHGCFIGSAAIVVLSDKDKASKAAVNLMKFFHDESCGKCTPCRVGTGKAVALMEEAKWNQPLLERALTGNDGRVDLRPGAGGAESRPQRHEVFPARVGVEADGTDQGQQLAMMPIEFKLNGETVVGRPDEPIITTAKKHGVDIPHLCYKAATSAPTATAAPAWSRSRASACSRPRAAASRRRAWRSPPNLRAR